MKNYVRNILIFVVTFSLVFGLCIVPSYAYTDFSNQPIPYYSDASSKSREFIFDNGYNFISNYHAITNLENVYIFYVLTNNIYYTYIASPNNPEIDYNVYATVFYAKQRNSGSIFRYQFIYPTLDENTNLYYQDVTDNWSIDTTLIAPSFNSISEALSAISDIVNTVPDGTTYNAYFDIPCGNVAYIKTGNDNTLTLSCTMPEFSKLTGSTGTYWTNTMEIAYGVPSYPPAGTIFPLSSMSDIQWFRSTEGRDLLGRTKKALFLDTTHSSDNFIVIYNPTYRELTMSGQGDINPTIRVQCSKLIDYHMYSLTGEYNSQGTISSYSIDGFSDPYVGTPTSDNENVQGTNSAGATPNIGGSGNEIGGTGGIIEYVQSIQNTLDNFANSFISLLKAPISHIQSLISSGTDYFNVIRGLYSWLPDEVQGTINSAMIVSISVGVIALLL